MIALFFKRIYSLFSDLFAAELLITASAIAFALFVSIIPFILLLNGFASLVGGEEFAALARETLVTHAPDYVAKTFTPEISKILNQESSKRLFLFGIGGMLIASTGAIGAVRYGFNSGYRCKEHRPIWRTRFESLALVVFMIIFLVLITTLGLLFPALSAALETFMPTITIHETLSESFRTGMLFALSVGLITMLHRFLPCRRLTILRILPGAVFTTLSWALLSEAFAYYLLSFNYYTAVYAGLAGIITALIFLEFASILLLLGARMNHLFFAGGQNRDI